MVSKIIVDEKALEALGLSSKAIYSIEYDFISPIQIRENATAEEKERLIKRNTEARELRNRLEYILKFHLRATRHLESSWIIGEEQLELAIKLLEDLDKRVKETGLIEDFELGKRVKIIPIFTTQEGYEHYEDKKIEFLLEFAMEHIKYLDKGKKERKLAKSTLWRCKQVSQIVNTIKDELKGNSRFNELSDTVSMLDDSIGQVETILEDEKKKAEAQ
jgi:hypothetical protein